MIERQDVFVNMIGEPKANEMNRIWEKSHPSFSRFGRVITKEETFRKKCMERGIPTDYVNAFLNL